MRFLKNISLETFAPTGEMLLEYAKLSDSFGDGESACMAYCKFSHDVVGSSNIKDIEEYCNNNGITYISTVDFLYYAYRRKVMTAKQCNEFIQKVRTSSPKVGE